MKKLLFLSALLLVLAGSSQAQGPGSVGYKGTIHGVGLTIATPGTGCVTFNFWRGIASGGPYILLNLIPLSVPSYEDAAGSSNGPLTNTTYFYVATCLDSTGQNQSAYSNEASVVTPVTFPQTPAASTGLAGKNN